MRFVWVRHPDVGVAEVPESAVPHLAKGWELVEEAPDDNPAVDDTPSYVAVTPVESPTSDDTSPTNASTQGSQTEES